MGQNSSDRVVVAEGNQVFTGDQIRDMSKQTLAYTLGEEMANKKMASLPKVNVADFAISEDMVKFIHNILINVSP